MGTRAGIAVLSLSGLALAACGGGGHRAATRLTATTLGDAGQTTVTGSPATTVAAAPSSMPPATSPPTTARPAAAASPGTVAAAPAPAHPLAPAPTTTAAPAPPPTSPPAGAAITIMNYMFSPNPLHVAVGTRVTTTNRDSPPHTWTSDSGAWDSGDLAPGAAFSHVFNTAGTFSYHCNIHPFMKGSVVVG